MIQTDVVIGFLIFSQIYVPTNPHGAETLPPGIVVPESDFYLRRLWGLPSEVYSTMILTKITVMELQIMITLVMDSVGCIINKIISMLSFNIIQLNLSKRKF